MPAAIFRLILFVSLLEVTAVATTSTPPANNATKTIAFSSAVQLATSVQWQLDQLATIPAIPMPKNVSSLPAYQAVSKLAPALPVIQAGVELPEADSMISDLISWNNASSTGESLAARQDILGVLIVDVQFVGPYSGTVPPDPASPPSPPPLYGATAQTTQVGTNGSYAKDVDPDFLRNSNHFAVWGRAAAVDKGLIGAVFISTLVSNARAVNPNLKFAIANVPQRSFIGGRQDLVDNTNTYNQLLPAAISQWSTEQSPIQLVELQQNYDCQPSGCPAGYDGLHPNAWGEYLIAQAFAQTLVDGFNIGSVPLAVPSEDDPSLDRDLPVPTNFQVFTSPQGVSATWDEVYGAYSYDVSVSINDGANTYSPTTRSFNRWDCQWPLDGWTYAVSVRASAGDNRKGDYTATLSALAHPQLAAPPENVVVTPTETGFTVTWDPPTGDYTDSIVEYNVLYWDWNPTDCQYISGAAFKSSKAVIEGLNPGTNYLIAPVTWNENGQGLPFIAQNAVPGVGTPAVPGAPSVNSNDPTTVQITWEGSSLAGGYQVWSKNINQAGSEWKVIANVTESTCNDELKSEMGPSSVAPSPASSVTEGSPGPTCPAAASWCPGGASVSVPPVSGGGGGSGTITVVGGST
ncbi:carbohydrate esterase family 3 protein [Trichoderma evansii]